MESQLRQDLVSGDWILMAPGRRKRPSDFIKSKRLLKRIRASKTTCPFENPQKTGHKDPILVYQSGDNVEKDWALQIIANKYPALKKISKPSIESREGVYVVREGAGYHELLITRNHDRNFPRLSLEQARQVFQAFRDRYLMLMTDKRLEHVSIFQNWGPSAGASIYHPHYQIIAIPVVPPDVRHSLDGALRFYRNRKKCVHCLMIEEELKHRRRIIYENKGAVAFAPFVSKSAFELRVFPKKHLPYFENTLDEDLDWTVEALQKCLQRIKLRLKDPDYNFFIHTAPMKNRQRYSHYHWHIEILPKLSIWAGFELGTGIEINPVDPDEAAKILC